MIGKHFSLSDKCFVYTEKYEARRILSILTFPGKKTRNKVAVTSSDIRESVGFFGF